MLAIGVLALDVLSEKFHQRVVEVLVVVKVGLNSCQYRFSHLALLLLVFPRLLPSVFRRWKVKRNIMYSIIIASTSPSVLHNSHSRPKALHTVYRIVVWVGWVIFVWKSWSWRRRRQAVLPINLIHSSPKSVSHICPPTLCGLVLCCVCFYREYRNLHIKVVEAHHRKRSV